MVRRLSEISGIITLVVLFFFFGGPSSLSGQTPLINGQVNKYARVTAVGANSVTIPLASVPDFAVGDTAMIMQMGGVVINATLGFPGQPGNYQTVVGYPGTYEISIISAINSGTGLVTFSRNLLKAYSVAGKVQLIKIRSYRNAVVNSELTCAGWDSTTVTGGVLAFMVKGRLTLNENINVNGKGFKGGIVSSGPGYCFESNDSIKHNFYSKWSSVSGYKGEGLALRNSTSVNIYPALAKGKGVSLTGGGGGNGHFSGGGGGSNYGAGSTGHVEVDGLCTDEYPGGNGGYGINSITDLNTGVYLGGGGGASTYNVTASTSNGGQGGGIIIILADTIAGNGRIISSNGAQPNNNTSATSGAGGGGGAGSVIISTRHFSSNPVLRAIGGHGGNTVNTKGCGGGGGGGLIWTKAAFAGTSVAGGTGGTNNGAPSGLDGSAGTTKTSLNLPLNGFLFNEIYSSVTTTTIDSICEGEVPPTLLGTLPAGGSGAYTYQWQRSDDNVLYSNVSGTGINYTPLDPETTTCYFRRVVSDGAGIIDYSMPVQIIVHPIITMNIIGTDTTLCYNQNPDNLYPLNAPAGGTGIYLYTWEKSNDGTTWSLADGDHDNSTYDPPALTAPQNLYHRIINSGACVNTSAPVTVTILPLIGSNTILADQTICEGMEFANLTGSTPTGGASPVYTYLWKSSPDNTNWSPAGGTNTAIGYNPQIDDPGDYYYKRIVYSGLNNTCQDTSASVHLRSYPIITGNSIAADQTICEGSIPATLTGTTPAGGDGTNYPYRWQSSIDGSAFNDIALGGTSRDYSGVPLSSDTWYRRIVNSSACADTSNIVAVTVDPAIIAYAIDLASGYPDTICTGQVPGLLEGTPSGGLSTFTFKWESSSDNFNLNVIDLSVSTQNYQPVALTETTWFRRTVSSGTCDEQSVFKITVLPVVGGNTISGDQTVCNTTVPAAITGSTPTGGDGQFRYLWESRDDVSSVWVSATGTNSNVSYQPSALSGNAQFRRNVYSGEDNCCTSVSAPVSIVVDTMPLNVTAGRDTVINPYQFAYLLQGGFDGTGTCSWSVISSDGDPVFDNISIKNPPVRKLGFGDNIFEFRVTNNTCIADPDEVVITVPDMHIPQAISPNNDGINDYFNVDGLENTTNELVIINTGGAVVYRQADYRSDIGANAWTGLDNSGNELPEGTYYYLLTITGATDISIPGYVAHISGFIIIKR